MNAEATTLYPFVPSGADFGTSLAFFAKLGFVKIWEQDGLAGLRFGGAQFILQNIHVPEWQKNQMITFEVTEQLNGLVPNMAYTFEFGGSGLSMPSPGQVQEQHRVTFVTPPSTGLIPT